MEGAMMVGAGLGAMGAGEGVRMGEAGGTRGARAGMMRAAGGGVKGEMHLLFSTRPRVGFPCRNVYIMCL